MYIMYLLASSHILFVELYVDQGYSHDFTKNFPRWFSFEKRKSRNFSFVDIYLIFSLME